jgi:4-amino-4-deoxy-L-arabinose transferase-like glycosyltransferase
VATAALGGLLLLPWIGRVPLLDADEPRFAECSRQMLVTGDWVYPQFDGMPRHAKPPLFNWLQIGAYSVLGVNETAARLPSVLAVLGTGLMLFWFTRRQSGRTAAALALVVWFALPQTHLWGRMSVVDPLLTFLTAAALVTAFIGMEAEAGGWKWYALSGVAMGLATMTKGPVGIVVPAGGYLLYSFASRSLRRGMGRGGPYVALLIAAAIALPWFVAQCMRYGREYTDTFFGFDNVQRYTRARDTLGPLGWLWPIPVVLLFAFPVSLLVPRVLRDAGRAIRRGAADDPVTRWRLFLAAWLVADALLFAPSATRLPQYFLALYPPLAMLVADLLGREAEQAVEAARRSGWVAGGAVLCGLLLGGGFVYIGCCPGKLASQVHLDDLPAIRLAALLLGGAFVLGGATFAYGWRKRPGSSLARWVLAPSLLVGLVIGNVVWPTVGLVRDQGKRELALACRERLRPKAVMVAYGLQTSTVVFYAHRNVVLSGSLTAEAMPAAVAGYPGCLVITHRRRAAELQAQGFREVGQSHQYVLLAPPASAPAAATAPRSSPPLEPAPPGNRMDSDVR